MVYPIYAILTIGEDTCTVDNNRTGHVAALVRSHLNNLITFDRTIEQTTETIPPKIISAAALTTNIITTSREPLHVPTRRNSFQTSRGCTAKLSPREVMTYQDSVSKKRKSSLNCDPRGTVIVQTQ